VIDPEQRHIWMDTCSSCSGSFLDAGEFLGLSRELFANSLKGLMVSEQKQENPLFEFGIMQKQNNNGGGHARHIP